MNAFPYQLLWFIALALATLSLLAFVYLYFHIKAKKKRLKLIWLEVVLFTVILLVGFFAGRAISGQISVPFFGKTQGPYLDGPALPLSNVFKFFTHSNTFERVQDIARDPGDVPSPVKREPEHIKVSLDAKEVLAEISPGVTYNYWTFNGTVPGPLIRARVWDTITFTLTNNMTSLHQHSVDFHAVTGPGGGAKVLSVKPGETQSLTVKLLNPGLYIYHCASSPSAAAHMAHGQYGLLLVEPEEGLPSVDKEFYVVQGEIFTRGKIGDKGLVAFDSDKMLDELPTYVVFNGRVRGINEKMEVRVGEKIRIFFGNGGVAKTSSFHIIGEIFDTVYPEASMGGAFLKNVQSTVVPAGGATIVEFTVDVPGTYVLVDHSLARVERGAWGILEVTGQENKEIYNGTANSGSGH